MKHNGNKQIFVVCYTLVFCCCFIQSTHSRPSDDARDFQIMQDRAVNSPQMSRREAKLLTQLFRLQSSLGDTDKIRSIDLDGYGAKELNDDPFSSSRRSAYEKRGRTWRRPSRTTSRPRQCFWNVVSCY